MQNNLDETEEAPKTELELLQERINQLECELAHYKSTSVMFEADIQNLKDLVTKHNRIIENLHYRLSTTEMILEDIDKFYTDLKNNPSSKDAFTEFLCISNLENDGITDVNLSSIQNNNIKITDCTIDLSYTRNVIYTL